MVLVVVATGFAYGVVALIAARFGAGDVYPAGSTLRADPLGEKALFEALADTRSLRVERFHGPARALSSLGDATLVFAETGLADLLANESTLEGPADRAARHGARLVVLFSDADAASCKEEYCRWKKRPTCRDALAPSEGVKLRKGKALECDDARTAFGKWGFSVRGRREPKGPQSEPARLDPDFAAAPLPSTIDFRVPAYFGDLDPAFHVVYRSGDRPVVVERSLGEGSLVLVASSFLTSNEGLRVSPSPALLAWLVGQHRHVVFDETHLGVEHRRGIVALARQHGLGGFFAGALALGLLFVWRSRSSWIPAPAPARDGRRPSVSRSDGIAPLLRRAVPETELLAVCVAEAEALAIRVKGAPVTLAKVGSRDHPGARDVVRTFNDIQHTLQERHDRT
jgi:hypothetical protein